MFPCHDLDSFKILIVNQTSKRNILNSENANIRVINSFEKGLSKSRNLALKNATCDIVVIADDDLVYEKEFVNVIGDAFNKMPQAELITFKAMSFNGKPYRDYKTENFKHSVKSIKGVISWEIALNINKINNLNITFDEHFGLGGQFETAEEYLFAREVVDKGSHSYFNNNFIVAHPELNSGMDLGSNRIVYARAALNYKLHNFLVYFWLPNYMLFLLRNKYIKFSELISKIKIGLKGIKDFKHLYNNR